MQFTEEQFKEGQVLLFDKPLNWTSFQLVNKVRWLIRKAYKIKKIKVGHAGTLDPLATGLLIICTGRFTKRIEAFMGQEKEYTGSLVLGATTPSYDLETEIEATFPTDHLNEDLIQNATAQFTGNIQQKPPIFSALKKEGKRLYEFARAGEAVEIPSREVQISEFEITRIELPEVDFRVRCSKGTYIRSLAHDFGKALESGGHLSALRRTKIGDFDVIDATSLEDFEAALKQAEA
ncbi:tRNA pseudouridine(55) synthase TruB [Leeuwenhoekiella marinoflava]|uniref:tRNA pseudouridine synthase B n=2 Tax=Leeuwenhoekiella marinoflava TaxID=988 RepID=A0A4Q0PTB5_9FLAO|nr:tRNA pseudouridine(55) synthase TruB [Leeuwenhoekiella marinoflava]RXG33245.1 tRNA pseudouridine synthase B [Leeuwenhoekiella marinoflava]SHE44149.1 tRNA pseudouridine synthase B [Leeuwenhoekiella marinoflava DSM 3653]